jgi:hypothetical protein
MQRASASSDRRSRPVGAAQSGDAFGPEGRMEEPPVGRVTEWPVWQAATVCLALLLELVMVADLGSPWRPIAALMFLAVIPGASMVPLIGIPESAIQATLVVPVSFAVVALTSAALFYSRLWSPGREFALVTVLSIAGFALQRIDARRRLITTGGTL